MKYVVSSQSWRASARSKIKNLSLLSAVALLLFVSTNAGLLWLASDGNERVRADHSQTPNHFEVVPGNSRLHVSWRPDAGHTYELRWRVADTVASRWNIVEDPGRYRYEITGLANRTEYDVQVRGMAEHSSASSGSSWSDWTRIESAEPRALAGTSNDIPTWRSTVDKVSVEENREYLGAIATLEAIGGDTNDIINYEILEPVRGPFAMNAESGDVYVYERLDFEQNEEYTIEVAATDLGGASVRHTLTIEVVDLEGPPVPTVTQICAGNAQAFLVWEQTNAATYHVQWTPYEDGNPSYSVADSRNLRGIDSDRSIVDNLTNAIEWIFRIRAIDKATLEQSKWSAEYVVRPSVDEDRANTPPSFRQDDYSFDVREEQAAGIQVGAVSATDADPYSYLTYSLAETDPPNAPFEVNEASGLITTTDQLDYEAVAIYDLTVVVRDLCGFEARTNVKVSVKNAIEVDIPATTSLAPAVAVGHEQVVVHWDNFTDFKHDLDWRKIDERYQLDPKDENASSPRVVEIDDPEMQYAFRIRTRNLLGQVGDWSPETVVTPLTEAPTVLPVVSPREGALLGDAIPYLEYINLRKGQDALVGVNLFNIDGGLENSLFDRDDVTMRWTASIGDLDDPEARSTIYRAPHRVGDFAIRVTISQAIPEGAVQIRLRIPVRVIGEDQDVQIFTGGQPHPSETSYRGEDYSVATFDHGGQFDVADTPGASFTVPAVSIPARDWIGIRLVEGSEAMVLQQNVRRFDTIGNWYETAYVSSDRLPLTGLMFRPAAEVCLPVPDESASSLDETEIMLLLDNGVQQLLNSPTRRPADPTNNLPARVCAKAGTFDGLIFLVQPDVPEPTATPVPPTATPTPTAVIIPPTIPPTPVDTPVPPPAPTAVVFPSTETPTPTGTPIPILTDTPTPTLTPASTDTPTSIPTNTSTPTPMATDTPTPISTDTPIPTATPTSIPEPASTLTPTAEPTHTSTPTSTATSVPTSTPTTVPTDTPTPIPTAAPPIVEDDDSSATGWIVAIVVLAILSTGIGAGAMIYRSRVTPPEPDGEDPPSDTEPSEDSDDSLDDDDEPATDDYEVLRYDTPRGG